MARLLITGGAGFIGANLVAHLHARGRDILTVLDNESTGGRARIAYPGVRFIEGDIRDARAVTDAMTGQDAVIHLAAVPAVGDAVADPLASADVNVNGSLQVLDAARRLGVGYVLAASSGGTVLGDAPPPVHEATLPRPRSPLGAAKLALEGYLGAYARTYGLRTCALRIANVYGPGSAHKTSVIPAFMRAAAAGGALPVRGDGMQSRDFLYVGDLVQGMTQALQARATGLFHLGSGAPTTINSLADTIRDVVGVPHLPTAPLPALPGEVRESFCDMTRAADSFGFAPVTDLRTGLALTWAWFQGGGTLDTGPVTAQARIDGRAWEAV